MMSRTFTPLAPLVLSFLWPCYAEDRIGRHFSDLVTNPHIGLHLEPDSDEHAFGEAWIKPGDTAHLYEKINASGVIRSLAGDYVFMSHAENPITSKIFEGSRNEDGDFTIESFKRQDNAGNKPVTQHSVCLFRNVSAGDRVPIVGAWLGYSRSTCYFVNKSICSQLNESFSSLSTQISPLKKIEACRQESLDLFLKNDKTGIKTKSKFGDDRVPSADFPELLASDQLTEFPMGEAFRLSDRDCVHLMRGAPEILVSKKMDKPLDDHLFNLELEEALAIRDLYGNAISPHVRLIDDVNLSAAEILKNPAKYTPYVFDYYKMAANSCLKSFPQHMSNFSSSQRASKNPSAGPPKSGGSQR